MIFWILKTAKKNVIILFCLFLLSSNAKSYSKLDSLILKSKFTIEDSSKVYLFQRIAEEYNDELVYDSAFKYTNIGLNLAKKLNYKKGVIAHLINSSAYYVRKQNQIKAIEYILQAYRISEENNLPNEMLQSLAGISFAYTSFNNYREAIKYKSKQLKIYVSLIHDLNYRKSNLSRLNSDSLKLSQTYATLSFYYLKLNVLDSAFLYGNKAFAFASQIHNKDLSYLAYPINCIGIAYRLNGNLDSAMILFQYSIQQSLKSKVKKNKITNLYKSYWEIAILFDKIHKVDSSLYYAELALNYCKQLRWDKDALDIQNLLAKNYVGIDNNKALLYYRESKELQDSLYNKEKTEQLQNIIFNEQEREKELEEEKKIRIEERKRKIQYSLIAISILIIIFSFIVLSRTLITSEKLNSFLTTLALLMVFEFLNLVISPLVGMVTFNLPILSFVIAICVALILSPLHNYFKNWLTCVMQRKRVKKS